MRPLAMLLACVTLAGVTGQGEAQRTVSADSPPRYWPLYQRAKTVLRAVRPESQDEYITLMTLSGLVARAGQKGSTTERIWIDQQTPNAYALWFAAMLQQTGATAQGPFSTAELVQISTGRFPPFRASSGAWRRRKRRKRSGAQHR
jgi:hypothetical protein